MAKKFITNGRLGARKLTGTPISADFICFNENRSTSKSLLGDAEASSRACLFRVAQSILLQSQRRRNQRRRRNRFMASRLPSSCTKSNSAKPPGSRTLPTSARFADVLRGAWRWTLQMASSCGHYKTVTSRPPTSGKVRMELLDSSTSTCGSESQNVRVLRQ